MTGLLFPELEPGELAEGWLADTPQLTSTQVLDALARHYPMDGWNGKPGRWVFVREVCATTGLWGEQQRFDALAVGLTPAVGYARVVYEVKVSRGDWLREMKPHMKRAHYVGSVDDPRVAWVADKPIGNKWDAALAVSTEFWYAAAPRCILPSELPPGAGLLEVRLWGSEPRLLRAKIIVKAAVRDTPNPDPGFWSAVLREAVGESRREPRVVIENSETIDEVFGDGAPV